MNHNIIVAVALLVTIFVIVSEAGGPLLLRPLSANEVYHALRSVGREDFIPEGRVVTEGISALTGFGLGLVKGIGGTLLVNFIASGLNTTALSSLFSGNSNSTNTTKTIQTQEICFTTRSLYDINVMEGSMDTSMEEEAQGKQTTTNTGTNIGTNIGTNGGTNAGTNTGTSATGTTATNPSGFSRFNPAINGSTAQIPPGSTSCIVIEKPVRKRRSIR